MIAALIRNGHSDVMMYGRSFMLSAHEELSTHMQEQLVSNAYAHRIAKADKEGWSKFVNSHTPKPKKSAPKGKKQMTVAEHRAVINKLRGVA